MANIAQDFTAALGATPPGTPITQTAFRNTRTALQTLFAGLIPVQQPMVPPPPVVVAPAVVPMQVNAPARPLRGGLTQVNNNLVPWVGGGGTLATIASFTGTRHSRHAKCIDLCHVCRLDLHVEECLD
jgi:hypothetical protein